MWALAVIAAASFTLAAFAWWSRPAVIPRTSARLTIPLPQGQEITSYPAIARDGRTVAYVTRQGTDDAQLYLRDVNAFEPRAVAGSSGAKQPFFSPDGKWVAFFAQGQLHKAEVAGGAPIRIAEAAMPYGGTWTEDNAIIYASSLGSGLLRIAASGSTPASVTTPDGAAKGYAHVFPQILPGGQRVLFTVWGQAQGGATLALDSGRWEIVLPGTGWAAAMFDAPAATTGRLLVVDQTAGIRAAPFDAVQPAHTSVETSVLSNVFYDVENETRGWLAVSDNRTAVYAPGNPANASLVWVDRDGKIESVGKDQDVYREATLSPDGIKAVVRHGLELWIHDLQRGTRSRLTPSNTSNLLPLWSRDGTRIVFASNRGGHWGIYSQPAEGSQPAKALLTGPDDQYPRSILADGTVLYLQISPTTGRNLWTLSPDGKTSRLPFASSKESDAQFSPEVSRGTRWVAYSSEESGRSEIYVQSYPAGTNRIPISSGGGVMPRWSRDGKELFYVTGDAVIAVAIRPDGSWGAPRRLFDASNYFINRFNQFKSYDVSPDGKRFLMIQRDPRSVPRQLNVILDWTQEVTSR
jgi:serine/threonine-protein kinase